MSSAEEEPATVAVPLRGQLVETKTLAPRPRRDLVPRERLSAVVAPGSHTALTLLSAPAGFGKTTLLVGLVEDLARRSEEHAVAWVSLDERDRDPGRFWSYVLHAVERSLPGGAAAAIDLLDSAPEPLEPVVTALVNELSVHPGEVTIVLDDYHLADGPELRTSVGFLLAHRPPQLHLVISTRADPALPLSRLRARGELVEIRAEDLRFTRDEVKDYLNGAQGLQLADAQVSVLEGRTEGWIAALQLAAASLRGRPDRTAFIEGFAGDDRYVVDYLADEVLDRQPPQLRRFLLQTSVLERLTGPLCEAVTGQDGGAATLASLERQNLLIVPLDDRRHWYRYHHLFTDVLRSRLLAESPDDVTLLHRRASSWFADVGDTEAAVRHSVAAGDPDRAADLIELAAPALRRQRREGVIRSWIPDIPPDVVARRPVLAVTFVAALMAGNEFDGVAGRLDELERVLRGPADGLVMRDAAEADRLPAWVATQRAGLALVAGDLGATIAHADHALEDAGVDDILSVAAASALKGLASWAAGDLDAAHAAYTTAARGLETAGHVADVLGCTISLVDLALTLGRLGQAQAAATRSAELAAAASTDQVVRGTADAHVAMSRVTWQRGDSAATAELLDRAAELGEAAGLPQQPYRWRVAMADLRASTGDWSGADALLEEAERLYVGDFNPNLRPVSAVRARLWVRCGDLVAARRWADGRGLSAQDELAYAREYEHVTLARILLAEHGDTGSAPGPTEAVSLLGRLRQAAVTGGRVGTAIEVILLEAIAREVVGDRGAALDSFRAALLLAEPESWVRPFADEGPRLRGLLTALRHKDGDSPLLRQVEALMTSAEYPNTPVGEGRSSGTAARPPSPTEGHPELVEPLSARERDVLRLLGSDLDGPGIARHLSLSLSTVRTHTQHVYAKLGVNSRRAAVRRAHQLNL